MADRGAAPFGTLLRRYRGARGLTQAGLAERSGLSVQAISVLERGARRAPRTTTIELLAQALTLDASEREALHAAARDGAPPGRAIAERAPTSLEPLGGHRSAGEPRWRRRSAALGAILLTALIVALPPVWWLSRKATIPVANLVGARVVDWRAADQDVGPLQTGRVYHRDLPPSFAGTPEGRLPAGVVPIVSYRIATTNVVSYVRSVTRRTILIFQYNPEAHMSAATFTAAFEEQSDLIRSARNPKVQVATSAKISQYRPGVNMAARRCAYIPPPVYVDYYLAAVYDPYLRGIARTDGGGFVVWQGCTSGLHRPRGLVEYGLGLGIPGSASCQPESRRTDVMRSDMVYLHDQVPDLVVLEYWWTTRDANPPCLRSWQFATGSSTGDLWRTLAKRAVER
jgi:transcriptional regulator with XRE-family HTH domain